jgi:hypothetical protein
MTSSRVFRQATMQFMGLLLVSLCLFSLLRNIGTVQTWFSQASGEPANLIIDTQGVLGTLPTPWRNLAQGGESPDFNFTSTLPKLRALQPTTIRLDHLYDFYAKVSKDETGQIEVDWTKLDALLSDINLATASPMLVLSYMPPALSRSGDMTDLPTNWADWTELVKLTVEHVSGLQNLNLTNVYYEVWNEPDLFGQWKAGGIKNYFTLYEQTVKGAQNAQLVQPFFIGGPATTALYPNWLTKFMDFVSANALRLDFYSWHIYNLDPDVFVQEAQQFDSLMRNYPAYLFKVEPIISEWGPTSSLSPMYDNNLAAAHLIAVSAVLPDTIKKTFLFEYQDGENDARYWGRWGILTSTTSGSIAKPRFQALSFLNRLGSQELSVVGQGSWVKAIASLDQLNSPKVIVTNYDPKDLHTETVPLTFERLSPGTHSLTTEFLGRLPTTTYFSIDTSTYVTSVDLATNSIVYLEIH